MENSISTCDALRSKDLCSVIEGKRRSFARSVSSSDSEDNVSNHELSRTFNRKRAHSPHSLQESASLKSGGNSRGRSFSNADSNSRDAIFNQQQPTLINGIHYDTNNRQRFPRAESANFYYRSITSGNSDDLQMDRSENNSLTHLADNSHTLSTEQRLAYPSQMSIVSRNSNRFSTPRESTVFTKSDGPSIVRLVQQTARQDLAEAIRFLAGQQHVPSTVITQDQRQTEIILEEDLSLPIVSTCNDSNRFLNDTQNSDRHIIPDDEHLVKVSTSTDTNASRSMLQTLKYSLLKHQQRKSPGESCTSTDQKSKHPHHRHRACCIIS